MGSFGTTEIILIVVVLFLLFGATRLPQLAKSLGQSKKAFKEGLREAEEEEKAEKRQLDTAAAPQVSSSPMSEEDIRRRAEANTQQPS